MDVERFRNSPVGRVVPIQGHDAYLERDYRHYAFVPSPLPTDVSLSQRTYKAVADAHQALGRLDFAVRRLPDPRLLARPVIRREAQSTSELEGTYAAIRDVMAADFIEENRRSAELHEVMNYVAAAEQALSLMGPLPICRRMLCELQGILVSGTRGEMYDAGELRQRQVFIGEQALGIEQSRFVPVPNGDPLANGFSEWERWVNTTVDMPLVVRAALAHYQFETLHPFSDGNGRLGRLVAILQLIDAGSLAYPVLNLSPWLRPRKETYKDLLLDISATGDFDPWVDFFATGIKAQANDMVGRIEDLLTVREEMLAILKQHKMRGFAADVVEDLIGYTSITPSAAAARHEVQYKTANDALKRLETLGILQEVTGGSYGRIFVSPRVYRIVTRP
jgi:Fic family protein